MSQVSQRKFSRILKYHLERNNVETARECIVSALAQNHLDSYNAKRAIARLNSDDVSALVQDAQHELASNKQRNIDTLIGACLLDAMRCEALIAQERNIANYHRE